MEEGKNNKNPHECMIWSYTARSHIPDCKGDKDRSIKVFRRHGKAETGMKERQAPENLMVMVLHADASPDGDGNGKLEAGPTSTFLSLEGTHEQRAVLREEDQGTSGLCLSL